MRGAAISLSLVALLTAGCATTPIVGDPAVPVAATAETEPVGTANADAADDPAIWRNAADPAASLIVATDKKAGLYVYDLDGKVRHFLAGGRLNNVDLVELPDGTVIVGASERTDPANAKVALFTLDTASGTLARVATIDVGPGEGYGFCMGPGRGGADAMLYSPVKDGSLHGQALRWNAGRPSVETVFRHKLATQPEGCVVDPRDGTLYVGEEMAGIWRFRMDGTPGELVASIDNAMLVADVEGLAIAPEGADGGLLVASSQGDNAFAVYRLPGMEPVGRFRIAAGALGGAEETDGIDLALGDFGPEFPAGLFVAQDGVNAPAAQNFKLVRWDSVLRALAEEAGPAD
ncbi:phytase [Pelagerythrobacter marensis]|uniref:Phytase n=1 Tax=Pelagerythrobacter marensis TaxID=543877 RepID=A0ABZ2D7C8_9SPHN